MARETENPGKTKQVVDFNKLRKRRQRTTAFRRLLALGGIVLFVLGAVVLNNFLVRESVTTRISDFVSDLGGSGYPAVLPGGGVRDVKGFGNHLAVLGDGNLYVYSPKGKQVGNFKPMNANTVLLSGESRLLTYHYNTKEYAIHSRSKTLHRQELEYGIITAALGRQGDYAIVSSSKQFICEITVYNKQFEEVWKRLFAENLVSAVSLSPKGALLAAGWVNGEGGALRCGVDIFRVGGEEELAKYDLGDDMVVDVRFIEEDRIGVLTERQYLVLGGDGRLRYRYEFGGRKLVSDRSEGRQTLLLLEEPETRRRDVVLLDAELLEKAVLSTGEKVLDMELTSRRVYLLWEDAIRTYDLALEPVKNNPEWAAQHVSRIRIAGGKLYYLTRDEICVLGQTAQVSGSEPESAMEPGTGAALPAVPDEPSAESDESPDGDSAEAPDAPPPDEGGQESG